MINRDILWAIIVCGLMAGCYVGPSDPKPAPPAPSPVNPVVDEWGFDRSVPKAMEGRRELALKLSAVMDEFANQIEHDGDQDEPRMISSTDVAIIMDKILTYGFQGQASITRQLKDEIESALNTLEPNNEAIDLTDKDRRNVVQMFHALAQALRGVQ